MGQGDKDKIKRAAPNVIDLALFRQTTTARPLLFYLNESGRWLDVITSLPGFDIVDIRSPESLRAKLLGPAPDIVLMESAFQWACPFETIDRLDYLLEVPIVLICDREDRSPAIVKRAFAAGIHDTLFAPISRDELQETLNVLLKFRRHAGTE